MFKSTFIGYADSHKIVKANDDTIFRS